jgi:hypothetical protein
MSGAKSTVSILATHDMQLSRRALFFLFVFEILILKALELEVVEVHNPKELNFILGHSHFIKTVGAPPSPHTSGRRPRPIPAAAPSPRHPHPHAYTRCRSQLPC